MQIRQARSGYARHSNDAQNAPASPAGDAGRAVPDRVLMGVATRLKARLGPERYARYFASPGALRVEGTRLDVRVASPMLAGVYDRQFRQLLLDAMREETGKADWSVRFVVDAAASAAAAVNERATAAASQALAPAAPAARKKPAPLRYELGDFIVGACNHVAHQAAMRLVESGEAITSGSPLFLLGPCGMGKSHLLQAIARSGASRLGAGAVKYVTAEAFSLEFSHAVRNGKAEAFKKAYRGLDLLCIDDIDTLATKPKTQIELQHVIDAIRHRGGKIATAGRDHPKRIGGLAEALVSRLCAGMVARIEHPDPATLRKMLRTLAQRRGLLIEDAALEALSQSALRPTGQPGGPAVGGASVRELEGLLTKVQAVHAVLAQLAGEPADPGRPIGVMSVSAAMDRGGLGATPGRGAPLLSPTTGKVVPRPVRIASVIQLVCAKLAVSDADLRGRSRQEKLVLARTLTAYLSKRLTTMSYPEIARAMGRPNHSTIITACQRMARQIENGATVALSLSGPHEPLGALCDRLSEQLLAEARAMG